MYQNNKRNMRFFAALYLFFYLFQIGNMGSYGQVVRARENSLTQNEFRINKEEINEADITAPSVNVGSLTVSQKTAVPGDTVSIRVKASDEESGIEKVEFHLMNVNGGSAFLFVDSIDSEGYYTVNFNVTENTHAGRWYVDQFYVYDNNSNCTYFYTGRDNLTAADFVVENELSDIKPPLVDLKMLNVSQKTAIPGDTVRIRIKASDEESGVDRVEFHLMNVNGGSAFLFVDSIDSEGYYTVDFKITESTHTGRWYVDQFYVYDNNSNCTYFYAGRDNLSAADFVVENGLADITRPIADLQTLNVTQKTAVPGDTVRIRVKASDEESGIDRVEFHMMNVNGGSAFLFVDSIDSEGYYTVDFNVTESTHTGRWYVDQFYVYDKNSNCTYFVSWRDNLSAADYTVMEEAQSVSRISYRTHVQSIGWQDFVSEGEMSGTEGRALRLEAIEIRPNGVSDLGIRYSTHIEKIGWQDYVSDGDLSGTEGRKLRLEAIKMELTGEESSLYDLYYRVHAEKIGWMDWAKNGHAAGTAGFGYRLEAIEIRLVDKGVDPKLSTEISYRSKAEPREILYRTHVQSVGWQDYVSDGEMSGTEGRRLRLEGIEILLGDHLPTGSVEYSTHVEKLGWLNAVKDGAMSGTEGQALRLEAIRMNLTGEVSRQFDIYYRVHAEKVGWMGWARNGEDAGTAGYAYRLEGIEIRLVNKGEPAPGLTTDYFRIR